MYSCTRAIPVPAAVVAAATATPARFAEVGRSVLALTREQVEAPSAL